MKPVCFQIVSRHSGRDHKTKTCAGHSKARRGNHDRDRQNKREDAVHFDAGLNANLEQMRGLVQQALDVMDSNLHDYDHVDLDAAYAAEHAINAERDRLRKQHLDALKLGVYDYAIGNAYSSLYALYEKLGDYVINVTEAIDGSRKHIDA